MRVLLVLLLAIGGIPFLATTAVALERPNIVILSDGMDRVALRAGGEIAEALEIEGFAVFAPPQLAGSKTGTTEDLVVAARRLSRPPLDIAILLQLEETTARYSYSTLVTNRLAARLIDIRSGRHLGAVQTPRPAVQRAPLDCDEACFGVARDAAAAAQARDLARLLAMRLDKLDPQRHARALPDGAPRRGSLGGYHLAFVGFEDIDVADIEEYLVAFRGYRLHRPLAAGAAGHAFWYETTAPRARLNRNLVKMLRHLRLEGRVDYADDSFTLTRAPEASEEEEPWDAW